MRLYNTFTRTVDELTPLEPGKVRIYTCGLTVYSQPHIGNWLGYIYWDVLVRTLRAEGFAVERTQNITDVGHLTSDDDTGEDKMEKGAKHEGLTAWDVADKYIAIADREAEQLGLLRPDNLIRATDYIQQQIAFAQVLETKGYTYIINGDGLYFDTSKLQDYGHLARLDIAGLEAGARVSVEGKRNITDFAIWKFSPTDQKRDMEWWTEWGAGDGTDEMHALGESRTSHSDTMQGASEQRSEPYAEYGERAAEDATRQRAESTAGVAGSASQQSGAVRGSWGFPGWHLECSVIARETLGDQIDIHTGGIDHIPVHHTNEIAQTEAVTGKPFSQFWVHNNHLKADGKKMSKSLGNIYTLADITAKGYDLAAFRVFVLGKHYHTEGNFTWENLEAAQNRLRHWQEAAALLWQPGQLPAESTASSDIRAKLLVALADDLDTPSALQRLDEAADEALAGKLSAADLGNLQAATEALLGIVLAVPDITSDQKRVLDEREQARGQKDWGKSDELRDTLAAQGVGVRDSPTGQVWFYL